MFRLFKAALEEAGKPLTTREIALAVIYAKGWDEGDAMLRKAVAYRLIQNLTPQRCRIESVKLGSIRAFDYGK